MRPQPKSMLPSRERKRVIFADSGPGKFSSVIQSLSKVEVFSETVQDIDKLYERLGRESFDICVFNLLLGGPGPFEAIEGIKRNSKNSNLKVIIITRQIHKLNIQNTIAAGAHDFIGDPFENLNLYHRILYHMGPIQVIERLGFENSIPGEESWEFIRLLLEANELLSKTERERIHESFLKILTTIASVLSSNRTSLIIVDEPGNAGVVIASSDDASFSNFPIKLDKYPEVLHVVHTGNLVVVEDVSRNTLTDRIHHEAKSISIGSLMVFPVLFQGETVGTLNIRRPKATEMPSMDTLRILQAIANLMAPHTYTASRLRKLYRDFNNKAA